MFGGGAETRANDQCFPIRPTAIRGQLQFWWRATVGAEFAEVEDLRAGQSAVWGSTEAPSRVEVLVEGAQSADPTPCARVEWDDRARRGMGGWSRIWEAPFNVQKSAIPYALFPFQGEMPPPSRDARVSVPPAACVHGTSFKLIIRCPGEIWSRVEPAVWAWINFGGLGCRTRRGCGAILGRAIEDAEGPARWLGPTSEPDLDNWFRTGIASLKIAETGEWSTIGSLFVGPRKTSSIDAWDYMIKQLRDFRQGEGVARDRRPKGPPSRSHFPEPDTIRRITGKVKGHQPRDEVDGFPRAEFGLPIVFHFKDDRSQLEPQETALYPFFQEKTPDGPRLDHDGFPIGETKDRMASPIILKPLALADGGFIPIILQLRSPLPSRVELRDNQTGECLTPRRLVPIRDAAFASGKCPINGRSQGGSALEAFLAFAQERGFRKVVR